MPTAARAVDLRHYAAAGEDPEGTRNHQEGAEPVLDSCHGLPPRFPSHWRRTSGKHKVPRLRASVRFALRRTSLRMDVSGWLKKHRGVEAGEIPALLESRGTSRAQAYGRAKKTIISFCIWIGVPFSLAGLNRQFLTAAFAASARTGGPLTTSTWGTDPSAAIVAERVTFPCKR